MTELNSLAERLCITSVYWVDDENAQPEQLDMVKLINQVATKLVDEENSAIRKVAIGKIKTVEPARNVGTKLEAILARENDADKVEQIEGILQRLFESDASIDARA